MPFARRVFAPALLLFAFIAVPTFAQDAPVVGSQNTVTADPPVPHPSTTPCVVTLFSNMQFADYSAHPISYTPPSKCSGEWAKVILKGDFSVSAGVQYDRSAKIFLNGVDIYYGTTPEPGGTLSPHWQIESDLTDYSALFKTAQSGNVNISNIVNSTYTGVIEGTVEMLFYPAPAGSSAEVSDIALLRPNQVLTLSPDAGDAAFLNTDAQPLSRTFTLPTNIVKAYLDVVAQGQQEDEFWYTCSPNDIAPELDNCGSTAFRETEVTIDGTPAGLAPVYPWIFTGGIDPYLWAPLPGVQTLNFKPYRVDLSPFAALLSNGTPHTVAVTVFNADNYFNVTGTLLLLQDPANKSVSGELTENTLTATPSLGIQENISSSGGTVTTEVTRGYNIAGYVNTSFGRVSSTVHQAVEFGNGQDFVLGNTQFEQTVAQVTDVVEESTTAYGPLTESSIKNFIYPLYVTYNYTVNADGTSQQVGAVLQGWYLHSDDTLNGATLLTSDTTNEVTSGDTLLISAEGYISGFKNRSSSQSYETHNSLGYCYSKKLTSSEGVLTAIQTGQGCP
jgi:hypothetical protein